MKRHSNQFHAIEVYWGLVPSKSGKAIFVEAPLYGGKVQHVRAWRRTRDVLRADEKACDLLGARGTSVICRGFKVFIQGNSAAFYRSSQRCVHFHPYQDLSAVQQSSARWTTTLVWRKIESHRNLLERQSPLRPVSRPERSTYMARLLSLQMRLSSTTHAQTTSRSERL